VIYMLRYTEDAIVQHEVLKHGITFLKHSEEQSHSCEPPKLLVRNATHRGAVHASVSG